LTNGEERDGVENEWVEIGFRRLMQICNRRIGRRRRRRRRRKDIFGCLK